MSGAEALFVIQMIGGCWDLLQIVNTVVHRARAFKRDHYEVPRQFRNMQAVLGMLHAVLKRIDERSRSSSQEAANRDRVINTLRGCKSAIAELATLFRKHHLSAQNTSSLSSLKRAVQSVANDSRINSLRQEIEQYINVLTLHAAAFTPTAREISAVVSTELEGVIDSRIARLANQLKQRQRHASVPNLAPPVDLDQSQGHRINARSVHISNHHFYLPNGHPMGHMMVPPALVPRTSSDTLRTEPALPTQFPVSDWGPSNGAAEYHYEPSIRRHSVSTPTPESQNYLHPDAHTPRPGSRASQRSHASSARSSTRSSTKVGSVFDDDATTQVVASPISESDDPFAGANDGIDPADPNVLALAEANHLIGEGDRRVPYTDMAADHITNATSEASRLFLRAKVKLESIMERQPQVALRKYRGLTHASLGLSRVTKGEDRQAHVDSARRYNENTLTAALRCADGYAPNSEVGRVALTKVKLDKASVLAREARLADKSSRLRKFDVGALAPVTIRMEAFRTYDSVVSDLDDHRTSALQCDLHAQGLLGCGQIAQLLQAAGGIELLQRWGCAEPGYYFNAATQSITTGARITGTPSTLLDGLQFTLGRIKSSWNLPPTDQA